MQKELKQNLENITENKILQQLIEKYPNNIEMVTIKALLLLPEDAIKKQAIKNAFERFLETNSEDEVINYLKRKEIKSKEEKNPNMIFVKGGTFTPSFTGETKTFDLYVSKYQITQEIWEKCMDYNPSYFRGAKKPVENINWIEILYFCNEMSKKIWISAYL